MKRSRVNIALATVTTAIIVSVAGSLSGTLAWYAYATRATLSFSGTSAYASERVKVGIHDLYYDAEDTLHEHPKSYLFDNPNFNIVSYARDHDLELDTTRKIIWGKEGEGLTGDILSTYLNATPYASSELPPVTSLAMNSNGDLTLYKAPFALDPTNRVAPRNYYTKLPLCFKVIGSDGSNIGDHDIWLTGISAIDTDIEGLKYALRIYYENIYAGTQYLLNPTSELNTVGETVVAGTLDLKGDGTYDYNFSTMQEIIYGSYSGSVDYSNDPFVAPNPNPLDDVNNTFVYNGDPLQDPEAYAVAKAAYCANDNNATTFLAAHENGVYVADYSSITLNTAKFETINTIAPIVDAHGYYTGGKPVAHTDELDDNIAYTDLTIYLEGWDHAIINKVIHASFNLGLQFEVNRL